MGSGVEPYSSGTEHQATFIRHFFLSDGYNQEICPVAKSVAVLGKAFSVLSNGFVSTLQ